jgi:hypothetical protein
MCAWVRKLFCDGIGVQRVPGASRFHLAPFSCDDALHNLELAPIVAADGLWGGVPEFKD